MRNNSNSLSLAQVERRLRVLRKALREAKVRPGWISYMRGALGMTFKNIANRSGLSIPTVAQAERREKNGAVSIETLKKMAAAMNCEFIYAFVPQKTVENILRENAFKKAKAILSTAETHMTLEDQRVERDFNKRLKRLADKLLAEGKVW